MTAATRPVAPVTARTATGRSRLWLWAALGAAVLVLALFAGGPSGGRSPLDPGSTSASGTKALMDLLGQSGATVDVRDTTPDGSTPIALLMTDTTSAAMTEELQQWVDHGGTLVVTDPRSSFSAAPSGSTSVFGLVNASLARGNCQIAALHQVARLAPRAGGDELNVPAGSSACFTDEQGAAFVVDTPTGQGHVVSIGSAGVLTNDGLGQEDNSVLAVDLLAPQPGQPVAVLWGMTGGGARSPGLSSLISTGVRQAFVQVGLAFLVYAWWRARRLGSPVLEPQPVQIAGSELVSAVGNLLQQTRDPDRAARLLRADLRRRLAERVGLPPGAPAEVIAEVTAARSGVDRARVARAVSDIPVRTEDELLDLARDIDVIRTEVLHGTAP